MINVSDSSAVRGFRRFVQRPADAAKLPQLSGHLFPRERAMDRSPEDWPLGFLHFRHTSHIGSNSGCRRVPCSSISSDVWRAHIALDGTQYVRSRKAITIRSRENCPIPSDTTGEYGKIYCGREGERAILRDKFLDSWNKRYFRLE